MTKTITTVVLLVLLVTTAVHASGWPPIKSLTTLWEKGRIVVKGRTYAECTGATLSILDLNTTPPTVLGSGVIGPGGKFTILLDKAVLNEPVAFYAQCQPGILWALEPLYPPLIPEPTTLALVGSGLGLLALKARRRLRR